MADFRRGRGVCCAFERTTPGPDESRKGNAMSTTTRILEGVGLFLLSVAIMTDGLKG